MALCGRVQGATQPCRRRDGSGIFPSREKGIGAMTEHESPAWAGHGPTPDYVASLDFFELFRPGGPYSSPGDTREGTGRKLRLQ